MSYPGNASLAQDIQTRILDTFQQTLSLVEKESLKEAELGCDFILRLDPMFEPARWLQDRLSSSAGDIVLDDIREAVANAAPVAVEEPPAAAAAAPEPTLEPAPEAELEPAPEPEPEVEANATPEPKPEAAATQADTFGRGEAPVPATAEEVMAAPVAALDSESEQRIHELLTEGQAAYDRHEYQSAIDAWSRIFLIDIDHPEANERIEQARKLKAEAERSLEETFHEALGKIDQGAIDEGRAGLEKVLELQPDHLLAREQLEKLDSLPAGGEAAAPTPAAPRAAETPSPTAGGQPADSDALLSEPDLDSELDLDKLVTPALDQPAAPIPIPKPRPSMKAEPDGDKKKLLIYVGAGVLALVLVGGWLLMSNWSSIFPNSAETLAAASEKQDPIEVAEKLHAEGKTSTAIAQLKRLPPHHELYSGAQALIAQWEAMAQADTQDAEPTEADLAEFDALLSQARDAQARREYLRVDELLTRAAAIQPLDESANNLKLVADAELEPLESLIAIFRQGEWEIVLRDLWRMREDAPSNPDINRLMVDSYYNLGVRALQRGDTVAAAGHFSEALELTGSDAEIERARKFAQTYQNRPEDLLYRIFVKYVPFR